MTLRKPWIAFLLNLTSIGAGHLYVGQPRRAIACLFLLSFVWAILVAGGYSATIVGFAIGKLSILGILLFLPFDAAISACKQPRPQPRWYMRPKLLSVYVVVIPILMGHLERQMIHTTLCARTLGYDIQRADFDLMSPTMAASDSILVDTTYYRKNEPRIGDVVLAQPTGRHFFLFRRISAISNDRYLLSADNATNPSKDLLIDIEVPLSNILGKANYIIYSADWQRIGSAIH